MALQLDFFKTEEECEFALMRKQIAEYKASGDRVRKGTYAAIGELKKIVIDVEHRMQIIERNICIGVK